MDKAISPLEGAETIHEFTTKAPDEYPELGTFLFAALEIDGRPEDRQEFEKAIVEEAHDLLNR